jgi:hypothetical protein
LTNQTAQTGIDEIIRLAFELHLARVRREILFESYGSDMYLLVNDYVSHILLPVLRRLEAYAEANVDN